jgi:anhydro-N-acetylmuramic acid kinase
LIFYQQTHPKSLGFEFVKETVILIIERFENITDKMRTFTEHIALQIATLPVKGTLFITGGAYNDFLIEDNFIYLR